MSDLDAFFSTDTTERNSHPLIRLLETHQSKPEFGKAKVEILRRRAALGFEPAQLSLQFLDKQDKIYDYKTEPWDMELNHALLDRHVRAVNEPNEIQRFGLGLSAALEHPETRYGEGFFSAVLMLVVDKSPFAEMEVVRTVRPHIFTNKPYSGGHSAEDCGVMIQATLQDRWMELRKDLSYDELYATRILGGALAAYLDERFSITDGRKLGWLKAT